MLDAEGPAPPLDDVGVEPLGFRQIPLVPIEVGELMGGSKRLGVVVAQYLPLCVESTLQQRPGLRVHAEVGVHTPDGGRQPCLSVRLVAQTVFHLAGSLGQNLSSCERVAARLTRVRDVEEAH